MAGQQHRVVREGVPPGHGQSPPYPGSGVGSGGAVPEWGYEGGG